MTSFEVFPDPESVPKVHEWLESPPSNCPGRVGQAGYGESVEIYTHTILNYLCYIELLPEGDLNVRSWW